MSNLNPDILIAGMMIGMGVYAWTYIHFHPDKLSPRVPYRVFRWLCVTIVVLGSILIVGSALSVW